MALKKSDLYSSLWASCDELRGGMDASQYKDYVLFMLFIKYVTDKYGDSTDFAPPVTIPKGASFTDMLALRGKSDIGDKINTQVIAPLVQANDRLARSDFPDFNDSNKLGEGQAKVERLTNLVNIFAKSQLDFSQNRTDHDDILGDAYEYLIRHFATESGKSKGQFYTPAEVSRVIARVIGISPDNTRASTTAYDPTCGSGSLLLKVAAQAGKRITIEGQEKDVTTAGLAHMNMILHDFPTANIMSGNTLAAPKFKNGEQLRTYDYVVANPPFSDKNWATGLTPSTDPFQRFAWGEPPAKQGDYAYLLHLIRSMKGAGKAACILPHGILFRGNAEATIRQQLVRSGYLKGIIGLPANLFYGTGIPACIVVLDKENAAGRKGVFMIDASKGFRKDGPKNRLREQDIHRIVDVFTKQADVPRYARLVPLDEIADPKNDFNLNLPRYIDSTEPEDLQDIDGHLRGGIPERDLDALGAYWKVLPSVRGVLFESAGRPGYARLKSPLGAVKPAILGHAEFAAFQQKATKGFADWRKVTTPRLTSFDKDGHPKALDRDYRRGSPGRVPPVTAARCLRRLPAPDGLLGRDHAGRRLPDRRRRLGQGRAAARDRSGQEQEQEARLAGAARLPERQAALQVRPRSRPDSRRPLLRRRTRRYRRVRQPARHARATTRRDAPGEQRRGWATCRGDRGRGRQAEDCREGRKGAAEGDRQRHPLCRRACSARGVRRLAEAADGGQGQAQGRARGPGQEDRRQVPHAHRGRDQDAGGGRQVDGADLSRRAERAGPRFADTLRPHSPAGRALRHAAAEAHRRGEGARRQGGRASKEDGRVMGVRPGYKRTEVGIIPEDWDVSTVGQQFSVQLGKMIDAKRNVGVAKPYLGNRAVQWNRIDIAGLSSVPLSPADLLRFHLEKGDLLACEGGEVGRAAIWDAPLDECYYQKALHRLRPLKDFDSRFMVAILHRLADRGMLANHVTQTSIAHLPRDKFIEVQIPLPPVAEQHAIATALSDVDALLGGLDRLIAKKRDLKQAAMQQLLTGQTRLPGFSGEWETKQLGDLLAYERPDRYM